MTRIHSSKHSNDNMQNGSMMTHQQVIYNKGKATYNNHDRFNGGETFLRALIGTDRLLRHRFIRINGYAHRHLSVDNGSET